MMRSLDFRSSLGIVTEGSDPTIPKCVEKERVRLKGALRLKMFDLKG